MSAELILVRHGRTDWNDEGRYQGQDGPGLNAEGRAQARATARKMAGREAVAVYTSDLERARETARIITEALNLPLRADPRLREIHQGVWQGMLFDHIQAEYAEALSRFNKNPVNNSPPGGETLAQLARRFTTALDDFAQSHPEGQVIVVTHKLPIAIVRCMAAGRPPTDVWDAFPDNAQALTFRWPLEVGVSDPECWLAQVHDPGQGRHPAGQGQDPPGKCAGLPPA
jgi:broad specificity phosphatase PhoE